MAELPKDTIYHYESKDGLNVTITMTELVRCKDCKHQERIAGYSDYQPNTVFCNKWEHLTDIQGHCYKGERKENEE